MVDYEQVLYDYLDSSSNFKTLIGDNLFCDQIHNFDGSTTKGCLFRFRQGSANENIPIFDLICDFHCYGGTDTPEDSKSIYRALHDRLHGINNIDTGSGFIIRAFESTTGQTITEPDTSWKKVLVSYSLTIR